MNCCEAMASQDKVVLGVRTFDGDDVPLKAGLAITLQALCLKLCVDWLYQIHRQD